MRMTLGGREFEVTPDPHTTKRFELGLVGNRMCVLLIGKPLNEHQVGQLPDEQRRGPHASLDADRT